MNINTRAVNIEITPALKDYAEKRFSNIGKFTPITSIEIDLEKATNHHRSGEIFVATVKVITVLGKVYTTSSEKTDLYEAIDIARDDIVRALNDGKKKKDSLFKRGAQKIKNVMKGFGGKSGFTIIELIVIVAIVAIILGIVLASLSSSRSKGRDAQRINDMHQVILALEEYYEKYGRYPEGDGLGTDGWDTPASGGFIQVLNNEGFLKKEIKDPITNNATGNYRYRYYNSGHGGCANAPFYVLQIMDLENTSSGQQHPDSKGWQCSSTNWTTMAEWTVGRYQ